MLQAQLQTSQEAEVLEYKLEILKLPATINHNNLSIQFQEQDNIIISKMLENLKFGVK